jgi:hypothetical protein
MKESPYIHTSHIWCVAYIDMDILWTYPVMMCSELDKEFMASVAMLQFHAPAS